MRSSRAWEVLLIGWVWSIGIGIANTGESADEPASDRGRVLADLGEQKITQAEVDFQLGRQSPEAQGASAPLPELSEVARQSTVHLIALQRQALQTLRRLGRAASPDEVDAWLQARADELGKDGLTAEQFTQDFCQRWGLDELVYRDYVAFRLSWQRYLAKHLTQENLAKHFANQRKRFDGSRFQVDMISLPVPAGESSQRTKAAERLMQVYRGSLQDKDTWQRMLEESESQGWQTADGRWVRGSGDLDPALITAVLVLEEGQISPPVHTATGVHLLNLLATESGQLVLEDVTGEVRNHMLIFLLQHLAKQSQDQLPLQSRSEPN
jgi:hypothetical protein